MARDIAYRAHLVGLEASRDYVMGEAEDLEREVATLRTALAALTLQEGGAVFITQEALRAAHGHGVVSSPGPGGVIVSYAESDDWVREAAPEERTVTTEARSAPPATIPVDTEEEDDVELIEDDGPEARAERYLATRGQTGARVHTGPVRPSLRPWDSPEDLAFQEVAQGRVEHLRPGDPGYEEGRPAELMQNDGSIGVSVR